MLRDALQRARQPNLSFFAFTATPKFKTKALFDEPGPHIRRVTASMSTPCGKPSRKASSLMCFKITRPTTRTMSSASIKQVEDDRPDVPRKIQAREGPYALPGASSRRISSKSFQGRDRNRGAFPALDDVPCTELGGRPRSNRRAFPMSCHRLTPCRRKIQARF